MITEVELMRRGYGIYHLRRAKGLVQHHGLACVNMFGAGVTVVHLHPRGLIRDDFDTFAAGKLVFEVETEGFDLRAARNRLERLESGQWSFDLLTRNCEHLVNYVLYGKRRSDQVRVAALGLAIGGALVFGRRG